MGVQVPLVAPKIFLNFILAQKNIILLAYQYKGMKGLKAFLPVLLVPLAFYGADGAVVSSQKRAPSQRQTESVQTSARKKDSATRQTTQRTKQSTTVRERTPNSTAQQARNATAQRRGVATREKTQPKTATQSRAALVKNARNSAAQISTRVARTGLSARNATSIQAVLSRDYSKCREVFNSCMDEFCANKDAQLKRCACSVRHSEFNKTKSSLNAVEDKLLNFSQRLLTVNMNKEDAEAINQETAGEIAFNTKDTSESKKMLDEIAKKLNTSFNDNNFNQNLGAISLSLNIDSAFDSIDSLSGANTTTKIGTALYSAALPVCREMATEVCSTEELDIAESSYQLMIEQDCNTVAKTYQAKVDQARTKVLESSALLDMSRLDVHQKKNSDDMLACKTKMLDMLTDSSICGKDLQKCLDTTGHFINPATGQAFLTADLYLLQETIQRPTGDLTWQTVPGNSSFINFLNTKKEYLEPATENCQDVADDVWNAFLDDALAQIKLAQNTKLEEIRHSCFTLVSECVDEANDTIADFDARALSLFSISADQTANQMCNDVRNACTALIDNIDGTTNNWGDGITGILASKTYEAVLQTCRTVGENCIIQTCQSPTGNFDLCMNTDSINRRTVLTRKACWGQVLDCVASAGNDTLLEIQKEHPIDDSTAFYTEIYGNANDVFDFCQTECATPASLSCYKCRITESIWGNCQDSPISLVSENNILAPISGETGTLMSWLAKNTATNSCYAYASNCAEYITVSNNIKNCCDTVSMTENGLHICCNTDNTIPTENDTGAVFGSGDTAVLDGNRICAPVAISGKANLLYTVTNTIPGTARKVINSVYCMGNIEAGTGNQINCNGTLIKVESKNGSLRFYRLETNNFVPLNMSYVDGSDKLCSFTESGSVGQWTNNGQQCSVQYPQGYHLYY